MELVLSGYRISVARDAPPTRRRATGPGETPIARAVRLLEDRARLASLDPRLLADIGLTPEDVARGVPFREPATRRAAR